MRPLKKVSIGLDVIGCGKKDLDAYFGERCFHLNVRFVRGFADHNEQTAFSKIATSCLLWEYKRKYLSRCTDRDAAVTG